MGVRLHDKSFIEELDRRLSRFDADIRPLPGVARQSRRHAFARQILDSYRRVKYVAVVRERAIDPSRADPTSELFDPIKAAILHQRRGRIEEAFWLVFIYVHSEEDIV